MAETSLLDAHLAEIDRRLRAIQSDLAPAGDAHGEPSVVCAAVSAGPFDGLEALARFEHSLRQLPGVRQVRLREYEGEDRAVYEVIVDAAIS